MSIVEGERTGNMLSRRYWHPVLGGLKRRLLRPGHNPLTRSLIAPRYTYALWLRVLVKLQQHGLSTDPRFVIELGPGQSLGIAAASLLTGAERYTGLDIRDYALPEVDLATLTELEGLLARREPIPGREEFPRLRPYLDECSFPAQILTPDRLQQVLAPDRRARIRKALAERGGAGDVAVGYQVPWAEADLPVEQADLVLTQAVMQCIPASMVRDVYRQLFAALRPGGVAMHQIDFAFPLGTPHWNYHRAYPDAAWYFVDYGREYSVTRLLLSDHLEAARSVGFRELEVLDIAGRDGLARDQVADRFKRISDRDFNTAAAFVVLQRPGDPG